MTAYGVQLGAGLGFAVRAPGAAAWSIVLVGEMGDLEWVHGEGSESLRELIALMEQALVDVQEQEDEAPP